MQGRVEGARWAEVARWDSSGMLDSNRLLFPREIESW